MKVGVRRATEVTANIGEAAKRSKSYFGTDNAYRVLSGEYRQKAYGSYGVTKTSASGAKQSDTRTFVDAFHDECFGKAYDSAGTGGIPMMVSKAYMACMDTALRTRP
jgi:hypothetical protein